jgi:hypothetical protein
MHSDGLTSHLVARFISRLAAAPSGACGGRAVSRLPAWTR